MDHSYQDEKIRIPTAALLLGLSGLLPFAAGVVMVASWRWLEWDADFSRTFLLGYGAVILSFLGGVRWGVVAVRANPNPMILALSTIPSLVAWALLLFPTPLEYILFALAFAVQGMWDIRTSRQEGAAPWYGRLRLLLSLVVVAFFLLAFLLSQSS